MARHTVPWGASGSSAASRVAERGSPQATSDRRGWLSAGWLWSPWLWCTLALAALAVQCYAVYSPAPDVQVWPNWDKFVHLAIFAAPVFCLLLARVPTRWVLGLALAHAAVSELVQWRFIPTRDGSVFDFLADALGVGLGFVLQRLVIGLVFGRRG